MRKIVIHSPGGHDRLTLEEHPTPEPRPGEVLIEVEAIGVNYADCMTRMGLYKSSKDHVGWPVCPGFEVAGRVAALGDGVSDLSEGDHVFAVTRFDAYATHVVVPRHQAFSLPPGTIKVGPWVLDSDLKVYYMMIVLVIICVTAVANLLRST